MIRGLKVLFAEHDLSVMEPKIRPKLEVLLAFLVNDFTRYIHKSNSKTLKKYRVSDYGFSFIKGLDPLWNHCKQY